MRIIAFFLFWFWTILLSAQDSVAITKYFKFEDGLYSTLEDLKMNRPTLSWKQVTATYFSNPQTLSTQVNELISKETGDPLLKPFFAVCIDGVPYVFLKKGNSDSEQIYAGLKIRGKIAYFSHVESEVEKVKIQAYNPLNGKAFRTGYVEKENTKVLEKILIWETGEILDFTKENLLKCIKDDEPLTKSVEELREWEIEEKLFKCLLIYNDRRQVYTLK